MHEGEEGKGDEDQLRHRGVVGERHQGKVPARGANFAVRFEVTDGNKAIPVTYSGALPDLFREGQGVIAEGKMDGAGTFEADTILAKHDENYMPREVADALKKQGHWMGEKK